MARSIRHSSPASGIWHLAEQNHLDLSVLHGDGSNTVAKKGGDGIGYSGHKHQKGEKVVAIVEINGFVLAPLPVAPVNEADTVLLPDGSRSHVSSTYPTFRTCGIGIPWCRCWQTKYCCPYRVTGAQLYDSDCPPEAEHK